MQIAWLLNTLNTPANETTGDPIEKHVSPELLARISADKLAADLLELNANLGPFTIKDNMIVTTRDYPSIRAIFVLVGSVNVEVRTRLSIDRDSELITKLTFETESSASPEAEASPVAAYALPSGPPGTQVQWLLDSVNGDPSLITPATIEEHFTPDFLTQVPAAEADVPVLPAGSVLLRIVSLYSAWSLGGLGASAQDRILGT